jgi:hypothetical protein
MKNQLHQSAGVNYSANLRVTQFDLNSPMIRFVGQSAGAASSVQAFDLV